MAFRLTSRGQIPALLRIAEILEIIAVKVGCPGALLYHKSTRMPEITEVLSSKIPIQAALPNLSDLMLYWLPILETKIRDRGYVK